MGEENKTFFLLIFSLKGPGLGRSLEKKDHQLLLSTGWEFHLVLDTWFLPVSSGIDTARSRNEGIGGRWLQPPSPVQQGKMPADCPPIYKHASVVLDATATRIWGEELPDVSLAHEKL